MYQHPKTQGQGSHTKQKHQPNILGTVSKKGWGRGEDKVLRREARQLSNKALASLRHTQKSPGRLKHRQQEQEGWSTSRERGPGSRAGNFMPILSYKQVWRGEEDWLRASDPRNNMATGSLDFLFASNAPDCVLRETCSPDTPQGADKHSPESSLLSGQSTRKEAAQHTGNF